MLNEINQDYKIKSLGLKRGREMNNVSYYPYSLSVKTRKGDLTFSYPLPPVVTAKSAKVYGL